MIVTTLLHVRQYIYTIIHTIMSLPDGAFPRLNASGIQSGQHVNSIASVVGKCISFDGASTLQLECVDGGTVNVLVAPEFAFVPGKVMEIMGSVQEDGTIQVRNDVRYSHMSLILF